MGVASANASEVHKRGEESVNAGALQSVRGLWIIPFMALHLVSTAARAQAPNDDSHGMKQMMTFAMNKMGEIRMSGDMDKDFATMMKMHHRQAVHMAQMELDHGKSIAMKAMATEIIAAQKKEIEQFDEWLATQK